MHYKDTCCIITCIYNKLNCFGNSPNPAFVTMTLLVISNRYPCNEHHNYALKWWWIKGSPAIVTSIVSHYKCPSNAFNYGLSRTAKQKKIYDMGIYDMRTHKWNLFEWNYTKSISGYNKSNFNLKGHSLQQLEEALSDICHKWGTVRRKTFGKDGRFIYNNKDSVRLALKQFSQSHLTLLCSYSYG